MVKDEWKKLIKSNCEAAGTYRPFFDSVIDTLSSILEQRDEAVVQFQESGGQVLLVHVNARGGGENLVQNPALRAINDMNRDALAYWRDLGLTPAGLKKIDEKALKEQKKTSLSDLLKGIGE